MMEKWKQEVEARAEKNRIIEEQISAMQKENNPNHQQSIYRKMTELQTNTLNKLEIEELVNKAADNTYRRLEEGKPGKTIPNLKRETTYVIVSLVKKWPQTEDEHISGLMQTEWVL